MTTFSQKVLSIVKRIPKGKTMSYKQIAELSGNSKAYRAVGNILAKNYNLDIPCHRVIKTNGQLGKYNRGKRNKYLLLKQEGAI